MKKLGIVLALVLLLTGCGKQQTMETVNDTYVQPPQPVMQQVVVQLPDEAAAPIMQTDTGKLYACDRYTISLQTFQSGDLSRTIREISGFSREELKIMETTWEDVKRYDFVWAAAGEGDQQVCRACILDDGAYHYVMCASVDAADAGQVQGVWREIFNSYRLVSTDFPLYTGS